MKFTQQQPKKCIGKISMEVSVQLLEVRRPPKTRINTPLSWMVPAPCLINCKSFLCMHFFPHNFPLLAFHYLDSRKTSAAESVL